MSGIIGIYFRDGRTVDPMDLSQMLDTLAYRGPDGSGTWLSGPVGLGHCMLYTTPESLHEHLPLVNSNGDIILTADARIDNREELLKALAMNTQPASEISDSEIILKAYEHWGERCPEKLLGDFSFTIWDNRKHKLFSARDHIGIKPFYYHQSPKIFIFASEIKAITQLRFIRFTLNEGRIADYLTQLFDDKTSTFFNEIYRLPPACSMTVNAEKIKIRSYWSLDPHNDLSVKSADDYANLFYEVFNEAVRCRLRSAFKKGFALSGGLDSSSIVCSARKMIPENEDHPFHTFSAIFPSLPEEALQRIDERQYMESILSLKGFVPNFVRVDDVSPLVELNRRLWITDEVYFAPNLFMYWSLYGVARDQGVRVYLDGIDGDVTVSHGLEYLPALVYAGKWKTLLSEAVALSHTRNLPLKPHKIVWKYGIRPLIPNSIINIKRAFMGKPSSNWDLLNPEFALRIGHRTRNSTPKNDCHVNNYEARGKHKSEINSALITLDLELLDKVSAAFSLEVRLPFFDRRLLELCVALPPEQKLSLGWTRSILRNAMAGILPEKVRWRTTKADFSINFTRALIKFEQNLIERILFSESDIIAPYVNVPALHDAYHRYSLAPSQQLKDAQAIYSTIMLAMWLNSLA